MKPGQSAKLILVAAVAVAGTTASACRSHVGFRKHYLQTRQSAAKGKWDVAAKQYMAKKDDLFGERDRVMYWLNLGTLQHYAGDFDKSQATFVKAEKSIQDLFTKSVTAQASKVTVSETLSPYEGEDFEKVLLYYYTALNNIKKGNMQDALVEARRADEFLKKIQVRYQEAEAKEKKEQRITSIYRQDAFMLWMVGLLYEIEGGPESYDDAYAAYKKAYEVYDNDYSGLFATSPPSYLAEDVVRAGMLGGNGVGAQEFGAAHGASGSTVENMRTMGEVIIIHGGGEAPYKEQISFTHKMADGHISRIALPKFKASPSRIARTVVETPSGAIDLDMAEPITTIALKNYEHQLPGIKARAIARAVVKYLAVKGTKTAAKKIGEKTGTAGAIIGGLVGLFANIGAAASEAADLRGWVYLPAYFRVARVWVPPGPQSLEVKFYTQPGGMAASPKKIDVDLKPGERKIVSIRTIR